VVDNWNRLSSCVNSDTSNMFKKHVLELEPETVN